MKQVTVYKLSELKGVAPEAFAKVHEEWRRGIEHSGDMAWQREKMDSLKAVVKACGARLRNWSIGADEDFIEQVYKRLDAGDTLTEALEGLADKAAKIMQADMEQDMGEETMLISWGDREYTIDGLPVT